MLDRLLTLIYAPVKGVFWLWVIPWVLLSSFLTVMAFDDLDAFAKFGVNNKLLHTLTALTGFPLLLSVFLVVLGVHYVVTGKKALSEEWRRISRKAIVSFIVANGICSALLFLG